MAGLIQAHNFLMRGSKVKKNNRTIRVLIWGGVLSFFLGGLPLRAYPSQEEKKTLSLNMPVVLGSITNFFRIFSFGHRVWEVWSGENAKFKGQLQGKWRLSDKEIEELSKKSRGEMTGIVWAVSDQDSPSDVLLDPGPPKEKVTLQNSEYDEKWVYPWAEVYFKNEKVKHVEFIQEGLDRLDQPVIAESHVVWK